MLGRKDITTIDSVLMLRAINEHTTKSKAAESLGVAIETLNKYIETLESEIGTKLLSTDSRGSVPTPTGAKILEKSEKVKELLDDIRNIKLDNHEVKGDVRVFISLGYASYFVPFELADLFDAYPKLSVHSMTSIDISSYNLKDTDIVLTFEDIGSNRDFTLISEKLIHCGYFASSQYLAKHGYPVDINDLF